MMLSPTVDSLLSADAVRERAHEMLAAAEQGDARKLHPPSRQARLRRRRRRAGDPRKLSVAAGAAACALAAFQAGGHGSLAADLRPRGNGTIPAAQARAAFDLAIVSVLLDAGAGPDWRYRDGVTGLQVARSEGLAIASLRMFEAGYFSADPADPLRADANELAAFTADDLARGFQVSESNPLTGLEGRAALIARLGKNALDNPTVFAREGSRAARRIVRSSRIRCGWRSRCRRRRSCALCCITWVRSGPVALRSTACPSATPGGIPRSCATTRPMA